MKPKPTKEPFPIVVETFREPESYELRAFKAFNQPSCFNSRVAVRRYRITVELIDEPNEVIAQRLKELWAECDNHHHWRPLQHAAALVGITLDLKTVGSNRKAKR